MTKSIAKLSAQGHSQLEQFGARIKAARLRRNLPQALVAERAGVSIMTYRSAEAGAPGCALGTYMVILEVLGLSADLNLVAKEDPLGRNLQDSALNVRATPRSPARIRSRVNKAFWPVFEAPHPFFENNKSELTKSSLKTEKTVSNAVTLDDLVSLLVKPAPKKD